MKKNPRIGERIKRFRESHYASQKALADALGLRQTVVSAWETGDNMPSCEAWVKLASVAPSPDNLWFLRQAGLDREIIIAAAKTLKENIVIRPKEGEMVLIPRFRETEHGREEAGPPVRLEAEFVPNPLATICLEVSGPSDVVDAPHGLFILDTSLVATANVWAVQEQVVMSDVPQLPGHGNPAGLYVGRLRLQGSYDRRRPDWVWLGVLLLSLTGSMHDRLQLGSYEDTEVMRGIAWEEADERDRRLAEMWRRIGLNFPLTEGVRILGRVIGRLTGHLEVSAVKKAEVQE